MVNLNGHIKNCKGIALMLLVLFSLSPCPVKETLLGTFDLEYSNPLNKTRAIANSTNNCGSAIPAGLDTSISKQVLKSAEEEFPNSPRFSNFYKPATKKLLNNYSGKASGSSPPKYILFKRLKFHLAQHYSPGQLL